jgi:hypothetical protein
VDNDGGLFAVSAKAGANDKGDDEGDVMAL